MITYLLNDLTEEPRERNRCTRMIHETQARTSHIILSPKARALKPDWTVQKRSYPKSCYFITLFLVIK